METGKGVILTEFATINYQKLCDKTRWVDYRPSTDNKGYGAHKARASLFLDPHGLHIHKLSNAEFAELAAEAGALDTTKGQSRI